MNIKIVIKTKLFINNKYSNNVIKVLSVITKY